MQIYRIGNIVGEFVNIEDSSMAATKSAFCSGEITHPCFSSLWLASLKTVLKLKVSTGICYGE